MAQPLAEAFVQVRPDMSVFGPQLQSGVQQAVRSLRLPAGTGQQLGTQMFGPGFQQQARTSTTTAFGNTQVPVAVQRGLAQQLFGPGFRDETGRALQGTLAGLGLGQLAAQFAFFGPGGAALATLGTGMVLAVGQASSLEKQLNILGATTGATEEELEQAGVAAERLGDDLSLPGITATESAQAITELAKAGLNFEDSISGALGSLQLAIAGELGVGEAAEVAASGLNAFDLEGSEAIRVADLLAGASIAAQGDIGDMALALQQSAAVADQAGLTIEQLVGLITQLAQQGIRGSDAGTSIRTGLLRLIPTTAEAAQFMEALGIQLDDTRTLGEQLPEVIDQYQEALAQLNPLLRQTVLAQIFGTDAIRFATTTFEQGSGALADTIAQISAAGTAADLSAARSEGLSGAWADLLSNAQNIAREVGQEVSPALEDYIGIVNAAISTSQDASEIELTPAQELISNAAVNSVRDAVLLMETLEDRINEVGTNETAEEAAARLAANILRADRSAEELRTIFDGTDGAVAEIGRAIQDGIIDPIEVGQLGATELGRIFIQALQPDDLQQIPDETRAALAKAEVAAREEGRKTGKAFGEGINEGIDAQEAAIIAEARATLARVREEGDIQILEAIRSARSRMESLGSSLGDALADVIDAGPIGRAIEDIEEQLDALQERVTRRQLRFDLTQAQQDLREAQEAIAQVGVLTPEQRKSQQEFLEPFRQKVGDAKAAVKEFDLTEQQEDLEDTRDAAVKAADEGLQRLIDRFGEGKLSAEEFDRILSNQLQPHLSVLASQGANLGFTFTRDFKRDMATLVAQAEALAGFTGRAGTAPGTQIERPAQTVADVAISVQNAEKALKQAITDARTKNSSENGELLRVLQQIRDALKGKPTKQPAASGPPPRRP